MENKRAYARPGITFVEVASRKAIADQCWSPSHDDAWRAYYNDPGYGIVHFTYATNGQNCGAEFHILQYFGNNHQEVSAEEYFANHPEYGSVGEMPDKIRQEIAGFLTGNEGTNFHANPPKVTIDPPTEPWSL